MNAINNAVSPTPPPGPPGSRRAAFLVPGIFNRYIAGKIVIPNLVLIFVLAVFATYVTVNLIADTLEDKFREELAAAGRSANEAMVLLEDRQLTVLRQMAFTVGVDEAVAEADTPRLQTLLAPIAVNSRTPYVDVFALDGTHLLALRSPDLGPDAGTRIDLAASQWAPVRPVLQGQIDSQGDKYAGVVDAPWGHSILVTAAPVKRGAQLVGALAIALPIEDVASRLSQEAGGKGVTLYAGDGQPFVSTLKGARSALAESLRLAVDQSNSLMGGNQIVIRRVALDDRPYIEALGVLAIRRESGLVLGVGSLATIIGDSGAHTRNIMIAIFSTVVACVLMLGLFQARRITRPVRALVDATDRIRRNDLDFAAVPVETVDETGILTATFNEMTGGLRERERSRVAIEKYMSPKVYRLIQEGELTMGGASREITVLKTDIRDFTTISETMEPERLLTFLNRYFERMVAPVTKYDGEVDKYMGDSILAKFGATEWYPDHARRAVLAMVEIIEACDRLAAELTSEGLPPIRMGIGANTGEAVVGNMGSTERMEYTIISDAVNTAQRIEELCKELQWDLLISETTYAQAQDVIDVGQPWSVQLRGQTRETLVYPILGRKGTVPLHRRRAYEALARRASSRVGPSSSVPGG